MKLPLFIACAILGAFALHSCADNDPMPEGLIPREKFVEVLVEVQLIEAIYNQNMVRNDDPRSRIARYYRETFEAFGISREEFTATYAWYYRHPHEMMDIYDEVVMLLTRRQAEMSGAPEVPTDQ